MSKKLLAPRRLPIPTIQYTHNSIIIKQKFYIPVGTTTTGELIYDLEEGSYALTYSSFFGTGSKTFKVAKNNVVDIELDIQDKVINLIEQQLPINIKITNLGANAFKGQLRIDTGFYQEKLPVELSINATKTFTFVATTTISAGTYTILAEILHNNKVILSKSKSFELIPQFTIEKLPTDLSFNTGQEGTITISVKNNGSGEGRVWVRLKIFDIIDEVKPIWLKSQAIGTVSFNISIPEDIEDRDYNGYVILKAKGKEIVEKIIPFHVSGVKISVKASLDKILYTSGEIATFTVSIANLNPQILPEMYAKVQFNGYEEIATFTLTTGTTTLTFRIPVSFNGRKLFYGIYLSSGRAIYLNTMYIYHQKDIVNIYADKQVFKAGATITLTAVALLKGTLTITTIEGYEQSYFIDGTTTIKFKLPDVLTSGTYKFSYTFTPMPTKQPAPCAQMAPEQLSQNNIHDEFKFDIIGYQAKVLESKLDKIEYQPGDKVKLKLKIELNKPITGILRTWLIDPAWSAIPLSMQKATFTTGESLIELTGIISAAYSGVYRLTYALYLVSNNNTQPAKAPQKAPQIGTEEAELLLASGAETFDVSLSPQITLISPTVGRVGIPVSIEGSGFGSNEDIRIDFGTTMTIAIAITDINGNFIATFTTISQPQDGTITITATGLLSGTSATVMFTLDSTPPAPPAWGTISTKAEGELYLEWNANLEQDLAGYKIYYGTSSGSYTTTIDTKSTATTYTLTNLSTDTTYYIALSAYDRLGNESDKSEERIGTPIVSIAYITSITHDATTPLTVGDVLMVVLCGSPGGTATFDVGTLSQGILMQEVSPGTYTGTYTVKSGDNIINAAIVGHLTIDTTTISKYATRTVTIDTAMPVIVNLNILDGAILTVATLTITGTAAENLTSGTITVNNIKVSLTIAVNTFARTINLLSGRNIIKIEIVDNAGNISAKDIMIELVTAKNDIPANQTGILSSVSDIGTTTIEMLNTYPVTMTLTINDKPRKELYATADEYAKIDKTMDIPDILKDSVVEFKLFEDGDIHKGTTTGRFRITIPYPKDTPKKIVPYLCIFWLNPATNRWELVGGKVDTIAHVVTVEVSHLSIFRIAVTIQAAPYLKKVIVYPNPFVASRHKEIVFGGDKVPQENRLTYRATIRIFSITGELIKTIEEIDGDGKAIWDGRNNAGEKVASGIYIYVITNPAGEKVIDKLSVIR